MANDQHQVIDGDGHISLENVDGYEGRCCLSPGHRCDARVPALMNMFTSQAYTTMATGIRFTEAVGALARTIAEVDVHLALSLTVTAA